MPVSAPHEVMVKANPPARSSSLNKLARAKSKEIMLGEYVLGQTLGEGEFGKVKLGWRKDGGNQVAIKVIRKDVLLPHPTRLSKVHREIEILKNIYHPNIVHLLENIETEKYIGMVLEYASGGELFDFILQRRYLRESLASKLFSQLVSGVSYLHAKGIVHRDLKLENLLLDRNGGIIISDFGFANRFDSASASNDMMATSCGSPCYAAPELVVSEGLYTGCAVDVWSCGVILYAMLAGYLPYDDDPANPEGDNINLLYRYIVNTSLTFPEYVSAQARTLLKIMLVPNPIYRAKLGDVQKHDWLAAHAQIFERNPSDFEKQVLSTDMERSTSARESSKFTNASSRLSTTGNQQVITSRRHTAMPGSFPSKKYEPARRETDLEADVASLAIGSGIANGSQNGIGSASKRGIVPPALARSATTNDRLLPTVAEKSPTTSSPSNHSRLPVPTRRPRPTSYQPVLSLDMDKRPSYSASSASSHRHRNSYSQPSGSAPMPTPMSVEAEISSPQDVPSSSGHRRSHTVTERMNHMVNVPAEPANRRFSLIPSFLSSRDVNGLSVPETVRPKPKQTPSPKASQKPKDGRAFSKGRKVGDESKTGSSNAAKRVMEFFRRRGVRE